MTCAGNRLAGYEIAVFCAPDGRCIGRGRAGDTVDGMEAPHDVQRVLVVDDEPSLVDAVSTALRYEGFEVIEATTGRATTRPPQSKHHRDPKFGTG
jgi:hypothetical protein